MNDWWAYNTTASTTAGKWPWTWLGGQPYENIGISPGQTEATSALTAPASRCDHTLVHHAALDRLFVFGGYSGDLFKPGTFIHPNE